MDIVREILVPAKLLRVGDFVPFGGWVDKTVRNRTKGLFSEELITVTFFTGEGYVDYTMKGYLPVNVERIYEVPFS